MDRESPDLSPLLIVGGGRIGEALLGGLLGAGVPAASLTVAEKSPKRRDELRARYPGIEIQEVPKPSASVVLAVKPTDARAATEALDAGAERMLSMMAGVTTRSLEAATRRRPRIVRAMPNMPALIGTGAAAISPGENAEEEDLLWAEDILRAIGIVVRVPEESMDAVTGLSGSGPAFVFLVAEAMVDAGVLLGLPRDTAVALVSQTLLGSALLLVEGDQTAAELRGAVTSPGGTTAAGLLELERRGVRAAISEAIAAAAERSRQLGLDDSED
ncbi:MAG: pyrroline-5-carboxylate reductase [Actinobacteria bacterium]|nr:pyrroline-5-carboxylate reductase [Actinomycetota bacterium]